MEDDSIPITDSEPEIIHPDETANPVNEGLVVKAPSRSIPHTSPILASPASSVVPLQPEPSPSSASGELSMMSRSVTSSQSLENPSGPETPILARVPRTPPSTQEGTRSKTVSEEALLRQQGSGNRRPSHRSPPYQRTAPPDACLSRYQSHGIESPPIQEVSAHHSQDVATPLPASPHLVWDHPQRLEPRPINEQYENLRKEYDRLSHELQEMKENLCCRVCMDREACVVFMPCAHLSTCGRCGSQLSNCPICRSQVQYMHTAIIE